MKNKEETVLITAVDNGSTVELEINTTLPHEETKECLPARYVPFMAFLISMRGMWRPFWKRLLMNTEKKRGLPILPL